MTMYRLSLAFTLGLKLLMSEFLHHEMLRRTCAVKSLASWSRAGHSATMRLAFSNFGSCGEVRRAGVWMGFEVGLVVELNSAEHRTHPVDSAMHVGAFLDRITSSACVLG